MKEMVERSYTFRLLYPLKACRRGGGIVKGEFEHVIGLGRTSPKMWLSGNLCKEG